MIKKLVIAGIIGLVSFGSLKLIDAIAAGANRQTSTLAWTAGVGGGVVEKFLVKCGTSSKNYTTPYKEVLPPNTRVKLSDVLASGGTYFCAVSAANSFGESVNSNEVNFTVGDPPANPANLTVNP